MIKTRDERRMTKEKVTELAEVTGVSWCHPGAWFDKLTNR